MCNRVNSVTMPWGWFCALGALWVCDVYSSKMLMWQLQYLDLLLFSENRTLKNCKLLAGQKTSGCEWRWQTLIFSAIKSKNFYVKQISLNRHTLQKAISLEFLQHWIPLMHLTTTELLFRHRRGNGSFKVGPCPSSVTLICLLRPYDTKAGLTEYSSNPNYVLLFLCTIYNLIINIVIFL